MFTFIRVFFIAVFVSFMASITPSATVMVTGAVAAWYAMANVDRKALIEPGVYFGSALLSALVF
jgi:hypothetical protein